MLGLEFINTQNTKNKNYTVLHYATYYNLELTLNACMQLDADLNIRDK